ncbi:DUF4234 domain-containing protein [Velocimicrobium porci]|uniref:DUF4234 domain-containing protein n=1 Tax=Velocimicrobium porci TaxID=2606634 RepID=A0A6L5XXX1_9FIRM|nr:DUF4234 domain-containing protein [Velocimicrobium porci]MSS62813.1 DUF4234 domain-containing protein [Velocimicrobium porci]
MLKQRNIALCIIFSIITCGIYSLYWFVCLTDDVNTISKEPGPSGGLALILTIITCGIYGLYWAYKCGEKLDNVKLRQGYPSGNSGILYLILYLFGAIISFAVIQNELNKFSNEQVNY